jgi:hypothetical protein
LLSLQMRGDPTHFPAWHWSATVHGSPSLQALVFGVNTQPMAESQESSVHELLSLQILGVPPTHWYSRLQYSLTVHLSPSSQGWFV